MSANSSAPTFTSSAHRPPILSTLSNPIFTTLHERKSRSGKSFADIAKAIGRSEIYTAAIFYGQAKPEEKDIAALSKELGVPKEELDEALGENFWPQRGLGEMPPRDPVIYRLYEALLVYGHPLKHLIHEKFGDGIMSAIDFVGDIERVQNPAGDRVRITLEGKFLAYKRW